MGQNAHFDIKRAKTEYGPYFTGWPVWNYALELAKCQRYFWRQGGIWIPAGIATAMGSNVAHTYISYPVPFRTTPSICFNKLYLNGTGAFTTDAIPITGFRFGKNSNGNALIVIECSGGLTPGTSYVVTSREDSDAYLEFNANL